jgi:hypothetical protein
VSVCSKGRAGDHSLNKRQSMYFESGEGFAVDVQVRGTSPSYARGVICRFYETAEEAEALVRGINSGDEYGPTHPFHERAHNAIVVPAWNIPRADEPWPWETPDGSAKMASAYSAAGVPLPEWLVRILARYASDPALSAQRRHKLVPNAGESTTPTVEPPKHDPRSQDAELGSSVEDQESADSFDRHALLDSLHKMQPEMHDGRRSPYQFLVLLWAMSRARRGAPRLMHYRDAKHELGSILSSFKLAQSEPNPANPWYALMSSGWWEILPPMPSTYKEVNDLNTIAGLRKSVYDLVVNDPPWAAEALIIITALIGDGPDLHDLIMRLDMSGMSVPQPPDVAAPVVPVKARGTGDLITNNNASPPHDHRQGRANVGDGHDIQITKRIDMSGRTGELPLQIAVWINGLASKRKRAYAQAYALARLAGDAEPDVPSFARKNWPQRARRRIDRLLRRETGLQAGIPVDEDTAALKCDYGAHTEDETVAESSSVSDSDTLDISWATTRIDELIPGLDRVGVQPIPYGRLPRLVAALFSPRLKTWSEIRHQTPSSLLSGYGVTEAMVRALLAVARDVTLDSGLSAIYDSPPDAIPLSAMEQVSALEASFSLVARWSSLMGHERPLSLRAILELDCEHLPADVAHAVFKIYAFTFVDTPALVTPTDAVNDLLELFDDRERFVMSLRLWCDKPDTLDAVAARIGVSRQRVQQIQSVAAAGLTRIMSGTANRPVAWYAHEIRNRLGPCLPQAMAFELIANLQIPIPSETASVLLYLAGPYTSLAGDWLENRGGADLAASAITDAFKWASIVTNQTLVSALVALGMSPDIAAAYLHHRSGLRQWDGSWVRWQGSAVDKAYTVLELLGESASAESINEVIGEGHSVSTVQNGMSQDRRFMRTGKRKWGLRAWGLEEYSGIAGEILERIDARGGAVNVEDLVRELVGTFSDISESSVRMYLGTPAVIVEGPVVRRRTDSDGWPISQRLRDARGAFRTRENELRLAIPITRDLLRGSGQAINPAVAAAVGVTPGYDRTFTSSGEARLTVRWRPWSTSGPDIGSVRGLPAVAQADLGDTVLLIFGLDDDSLDAIMIPSGTDGLSRLTTILGAQAGDDPTTLVASSLECRASEVRSTLRARGDGELADLLPATTDARLESEIEGLIAQLR